MPADTNFKNYKGYPVYPTGVFYRVYTPKGDLIGWAHSKKQVAQLIKDYEGGIIKVKPSMRNPQAIKARDMAKLQQYEVQIAECQDADALNEIEKKLRGIERKWRGNSERAVFHQVIACHQKIGERRTQIEKGIRFTAPQALYTHIYVNGALSKWRIRKERNLGGYSVCYGYIKGRFCKTYEEAKEFALAKVKEGA